MRQTESVCINRDGTIPVTRNHDSFQEERKRMCGVLEVEVMMQNQNCIVSIYEARSPQPMEELKIQNSTSTFWAVSLHVGAPSDAEFVPIGVIMQRRPRQVRATFDR